MGTCTVIIRGVDFTSAPKRKKPITCAECSLENGKLSLRGIEIFEGFGQFEALLARKGEWILGIDFPFGQSRKFIENIGWPNNWSNYIGLVASMTKEEFCKALEDYKKDRNPGDKEHKRETDKMSGSISPQKLYGIPVGKMFFEGAKRLLDSTANILPLRPTSNPGTVVEAYPALVVRRWIGEKRDYKSDNKKKPNPRTGKCSL